MYTRLGKGGVRGPRVDNEKINFFQKGGKGGWGEKTQS